MSITATSSVPPVLIVGSGPSGLVLALALAKNGIPVRIIEKLEEPRRGQRGAGIQPRSLELFTQLGLIEEILGRAVATPVIRKYKSAHSFEVLEETMLVPIRESTPTNPHLNPLILGQDNLEHLLREKLATFGCSVKYGTELISFKQDDNSVEVLLRKHRHGKAGDVDESQLQAEDEVARYQWLVGADGAKGEVRKQLGLTFLGETRSEDLIIGDIVAEGLDSTYWHMWGNPSELIVGLRPTETPGLFAFIIGGSTVDTAALAHNEPAIREYLTHHLKIWPGITIGEMVWNSLYRPNIRMVNSFGNGRVYVTGDAAHVHPPTGAQGMNSGVQDSLNLAWKLSLVITGRAPSTLLETYTEERLPVIAEVLNLSSKLLEGIMRQGDSRAPITLGGPKMLQLGVNYRWSSIVVDESTLPDGASENENGKATIGLDPYGVSSKPGILQAGDRAPDSNGLVPLVPSSNAVSSGVSRLFQLFKPTYHTVLVFSADLDSNGEGNSVQALRETNRYPKEIVKSVLVVKQGQAGLPVDQADFALEDRDGHAYAAYVYASGCRIVVVRPDGIVGALLKTPESIKAYFQGIFHAHL